MTQPERWSRIINVVGGVALLIGAIDPLEGSVLILPGSGLLALASYVSGGDGRAKRYRVWSFGLVTFGVTALFGMSALGGVGGQSGHSVWWALLVLPYVVGWWIDVWGPGTPTWHMLAGMAVGAWYIAVLALMVRTTGHSAHTHSIVPAAIVGVIGLATIVACAARLLRGAST